MASLPLGLAADHPNRFEVRCNRMAPLPLGFAADHPNRFEVRCKCMAPLPLGEVGLSGPGEGARKRPSGDRCVPKRSVQQGGAATQDLALRPKGRSCPPIQPRIALVNLPLEVPKAIRDRSVFRRFCLRRSKADCQAVGFGRELWSARAGGVWHRMQRRLIWPTVRSCRSPLPALRGRPLPEGEVTSRGSHIHLSTFDLEMPVVPAGPRAARPDIAGFRHRYRSSSTAATARLPATSTYLRPRGESRSTDTQLAEVGLPFYARREGDRSRARSGLIS
jgi:hypothetical protein